MSDSAGYKPEAAYSIDNFELRSIETERLDQQILALDSNIYSYFTDNGDTIRMGALSYDTLAGRQRMDVVADEEPGEYIGATMKDVVLEADSYYRFRAHISAFGNDLMGILALTTEHSAENLHSMKVFDVSQPAELVFHSGAGGLQTLLVAMVSTDSAAYYYADSLILETVEMTDSILYANDFSGEAAGWRSSFADSIPFAAGRVEWEPQAEQVRIWPWGDEQGILGAVTREIEVVPGIYNMVTARVRRPDAAALDVSLGAYQELSDNVTFATLSSAPYAHVEASGFTDTTLSFWFLPDREQVSLVVLFKGTDYSRLVLDDVVVMAIDPFERDTLLSLTFDDTSDVYGHWRNSIWPDSMISGDSTTAGLITHDTAAGRMRVDLVPDPYNQNNIGHYVGAVSRSLDGLLTGKEYELSYHVGQGGASLRKMQVMLLPQSSFEMGALNPSEQLFLDSTQIGDSIVLSFTAIESQMSLMVIGESKVADNYYYVDDFSLRQAWVKSVDCSRSNLLYADNRGYRFGFNNHEMDNEVYERGGSYTTEFRLYASRTGRWLSMDPLNEKFPWQSPYVGIDNNPTNGFDPDGAAFWHSKAKKMALEYKGVLQRSGYTDVKIQRSKYHGQKTWTVTGGKIDYDGAYSTLAMKIKPNGPQEYSDREKLFSNTITTYQSSWDDTQFGQHNAADYRPPQANGISFTVGGKFSTGGGASQSFTLAITPKGIQSYTNIGATLGNDVSIGAGVSVFNIKDFSDWRKQLTGGYVERELGVMGISINQMNSYDFKKKENTSAVFGMGIGFSLGSRQLPLGNVSVTTTIGNTERNDSILE